MLRSEQIVSLLKAGEEVGAADPLVIAPTPNYEECTRQGAASIDLRLGTWFVTLRQARMSHLSVQDQEPQFQLTKTHYVPFGADYFLHPGSFVLGTTLEWVRFPKDLAGYVIGKSSWGRRGLVIATATGVHPGFKGCLTLELSNVGEIPIAIRPGMRICQIFLHRVERTSSDYVDRSQFVGSRKPRLGKVALDDVYRSLTDLVSPSSFRDTG